MYGGDTDQLVYYELFREVTGQVPTNVPERGTGVTTPVVVRLLFAKNGIAADRVEGLTRAALGLIPQYLSKHCDRLVATGKVMPGAAAALQAVREDPRFVSTAVTGNLRSVAHIKLAAFGLAAYLDLDSGGFSSDDERRPRLVGVAQTRAGAHYRTQLTHANTVSVGDSLEDVRTAQSGGCRLLAVASGTTPVSVLGAGGADLVFNDLTDTAAVVAALAELGGANAHAGASSGEASACSAAGGH